MNVQKNLDDVILFHIYGPRHWIWGEIIFIVW